MLEGRTHGHTAIMSCDLHPGVTSLMLSSDTCASRRPSVLTSILSSSGKVTESEPVCDVRKQGEYSCCSQHLMCTRVAVGKINGWRRQVQDDAGPHDVCCFCFFSPEHGRLLPPDYPATRRRELASIVGSLMHEIAVPSSQQLSLAAPRSRHHPPTPVTTPTRE